MSLRCNGTQLTGRVYLKVIENSPVCLKYVRSSKNLHLRRGWTGGRGGDTGIRGAGAGDGGKGGGGRGRRGVGRGKRGRETGEEGAGVGKFLGWGLYQNLLYFTGFTLFLCTSMQ